MGSAKSSYPTAKPTGSSASNSGSGDPGPKPSDTLRAAKDWWSTSSRGTVPKFTVDLSQPPIRRYAHIALAITSRIDTGALPVLFSELLHALAGPVLGWALVRLAPLILRRVHSSEETAELKGLATASGVALHVLVAFNVLLDLLLGCTSCGVRVFDSSARGRSEPGAADSRMLHFRTLDWGMDELRKLVIELDFVERPGGPVVATTITYFGFVGVLTGVRRGLSMSLNFRPRHDRSTWRKRIAFRWHQAMVVLGFRPAICSVLRRILFDRNESGHSNDKRSNDHKRITQEESRMANILSMLATSQSTSAYLIFCTPQRVYVVEKDHKAATFRDSDTYLTAYNHDARDETDPSALAATAAELSATEANIGMTDLVAYSLDRKNRLDKLWNGKVKTCRVRFGREDRAVSVADVMHFVKDREISNEETHYACVMDPAKGEILWRRLYDVE